MNRITPEAADFTCERIEVDGGEARRALDCRLAALPPPVADVLYRMHGERMWRAGA